jgi:hypothetical protein
VQVRFADGQAEGADPMFYQKLADAKRQTPAVR